MPIEEDEVRDKIVGRDQIAEIGVHLFSIPILPHQIPIERYAGQSDRGSIISNEIFNYT